MSAALLRYRVLAYVVGVLLILLVLVCWPLELFAADGTRLHDIGATGTRWLGVTHGWLYMLFLVMAALLARRAGWSIGFTIATLLLGTVPVASFWAERRATARTRELSRSAGSGP